MLEHTRKSQLLEKVKEIFNEALAYDHSWQQNAQEAFAFRDNDQWDKNEKDLLEAARRPALTLNVIKSHIDLIKGLNEDLKKRFVCSPVSKDDGFLCEILNNVVYWLYQKNDWDSEEDNAYESALISGRGWVALDFNVDEKQINEIKLTETSIPIHEVRHDPAARKRDLSDASHIFWDRWLSLEDFCVKYPRFEKKAKEAFDLGVWPKSDIWATAPEISQIGHDLNDESDYEDELDIQYYDSKKRQIRVCHMEYCKYVKKYWVADPIAKDWVKVREPWEDFKAKWDKLYPGEDIVYETRNEKEIWWLQFCGSDILVHAKSPIDYPGFSIVPCFLYSDVSRRSGHHFGIVELMKDPQREINKRSSQTLNLFNQQVQPGVYAESQAFVNTDQAEQSLKEAGSITWLKDGALTQKRFEERSVPTFPTAVLQMGEYSREMLRHITGINPDLLGMNDKRQEAGIVVQLRQQQGMAILKPAFKAYQEMKRQLFERQIRIIMKHMPMKQIKKILGEGNRYQVQNNIIIDTESNLQCDFRNVSDAAYDIDAEPESDSLTANALEMATFMELQKNGMPVDPAVIVSKTNLPISEKLKWIEYIESSQKAASESEQAQRDLEKFKLESEHQYKMKKLELDMMIAKRKADDAREKDVLKGSIDQEKLTLQKTRDDQTAQIKFIQVLTNAKLGQTKAQQEGVKILLEADIAKKRLLLDTIQIMAEAGMAGQELKVKAAVDMYKEALKAKTMVAAEENKMVMKILEIFSSGAETKLKAGTDLAKEEIKAKAAKESAEKMKQAGGDNSAKTGQQTKNDKT
jgi:hypothetical protein